MWSRLTRPARCLALFTVAVTAGWYAGRNAYDRGFHGEESVQARVNVNAPVATRGFPDGSRRAAWMTRVAAAQSTDFPRLFAELRVLFPQETDAEHEEDPRHQAAVRFLIGHWLARDAEAVIAFAGQTDYDSDLNGMAGELLGRAWPEKAVAMIKDKGVQNLPGGFARAALWEICELHPAVYLTFDPRGDRDGEFDGLWSWAVKALAATDPAAAAQAWLLYMPSDNFVPDYASLTKLVSAWQLKDSAAARSWAESLPDEDSRRLALGAWLTGLSTRSPAEALKELAGMQLGPAVHFLGGSYGDPWDAGTDVRLTIARELAKRDLAGALAASRELAAAFPDTTEGERASSLILLRQWMVRSRLADLPDEPAAFMDALQAMDATATALDADDAWWKNVVQLQLSERIAAWSLDQCLTAAQVSPSVDGEVLRALLQRAAEANPALALERLPQLPPETAPLMRRLLFDAWPEADTAGRQQLLASLPADQWDSGMVSSLRGSETEFAATFAAQDGELVAQFAKGWADGDPAAAAQWVTALPENNAWLAAGDVAAVWASQDEAAASAWVDSLPPGENRDQAAAGLVRVLAPADPQSAWEWALSIQSPWSRTEALGEVATALGELAPTALTKDRKDAAGAIIGPRRKLSNDPATSP